MAFGVRSLSIFAINKSKNFAKDYFIFLTRYWSGIFIILSVIGVLDAGYLALEHFKDLIPPCANHIFFADCGKVLRSQYAVVFGIPVALIGFIYYSFLTGVLSVAVVLRNHAAKVLAVVMTTIGFLTSLYFFSLQLLVIHAICLFCVTSALTSTLLFFLVQGTFVKERKLAVILFSAVLYRYMVKPLLFLSSPEFIHDQTIMLAQRIGKVTFAKAMAAYFFRYGDAMLEQKIAGITFKNPVGLSAGFDNEAQLTQLLPSIGFGFETIGTITNLPYKGNAGSMFGRLSRSKSLMVNGFKNLGVKKTISRLSRLHFAIPIGISIGRTNRQEVGTQTKSIKDIISSFSVCERSRCEHAYYELNISCPNLYGNVSFYPPEKLDKLLTKLDTLQLRRPLFIKMPIEKSDEEVLAMLNVIARHSVTGVIFGNLQKDRSYPTFDKKELQKFPIGNFSGKPTFAWSNHLIALTYRYYGDRFVIIGSGGIFSAEDAYHKITLGASLVQLITGMIFIGPQLIPNINIRLTELLKKDGFTHISQAVGSRNKYYRLPMAYK